MKKAFWITFILLIISFIYVSPVEARSYSIDKVHIKVWIQPNGNLFINETFAYSFAGKYNEAKRSLPLDGHKGIHNFEAYELLNKEATLGFIDRNELRPLKVEQNNNNFYAKLPAHNEKKTLFYSYELEKAVRSFDTYSDLTIPFFGEGKNHNVDLHNVTIDLIFPEPVSNYHSFIYDLNGERLEQTEEGVRFFTSIAHKRKLTEVRVLFPSNIMKEQSKQAAPVSLKEALQQEEERMKVQAEKTEAQSQTAQFLYIVAVLFIVAAVGLLFLPQRILRGRWNEKELAAYPPLYLYVISRAGRRDNKAFFAGTLSLVEKGSMAICNTNTLTRFAQDDQAPARTLSFSFRPDSKQLSDCESTILDWLFTRKVKGGIRMFTMNNIYGATATEKKEKKDMYGYYVRRFRFMQMERRWFQCVIQEMKKLGYLHDSINRIAVKVLLGFIVGAVLFSYVIDSASGLGILLYLAVAGYLLRKFWKADNDLYKYLLVAVSLLAVLFFVGFHVRIPYILFILSSTLLLVIMPKFFLSREASYVRADLRMFRKQLKQKGLPLADNGEQLDRWAGLALILGEEALPAQLKEYKEWMKTAPLFDFIHSEGNPLNYLFRTWKLSRPPLSFYKKNSTERKDSSSTAFDSSGGGASAGGDSGGGAGAD